MCEVLQISPKTYYKYRFVKDKDYEDYKLIRKIFNQNMKTYGYRRITDSLTDDYGVIYNHKRVLRIMNKYGIQALYIKNQQRNYTKEHFDKYTKPDLLQRKFNQPGWVTDVTYLSFGNKRAFLSSILDLDRRKVIAYQISHRNDIKLVMDTLFKALKKAKDPNGIILHSDQGWQYFTHEYRTVCESNGILISMSRKGTPLDNAVIESFHALLKKETLYNNDIKSLIEYIKTVHQWIKFYNTKRLKQKK